MSHSFVRALAKRYHERIDLVADTVAAPIGNLMPEITNVFGTSFGHGSLNIGTRRKLAARLRPRNYARAFVLPNLLKDALVPWLARIPERHGWRGECRFGLINRLRLHRHFPSNVHRAKFFASLAHPVGEDFELLLPSLEFDPALQAKVCAEHGLERASSWVALAVGTSNHHLGKLWPYKNYANLASELAQDGHRVVLCGSKGDAVVADKVQALLSPESTVNLAGQLSLEETASVLAMCSAVVANDSGLMHLGAALGSPTLGIFGPTDPRQYHPLGKNAHYLAPAKPGPIEQVKPETVLATVRTMLGNTPPPLTIDDDHPGANRLQCRAYDRTVPEVAGTVQRGRGLP